MDFNLNQKVLAKLCGVTERTIQNWMKQGLPYVKPSPRTVFFDLYKAIPWVRDNVWTPSLDDKGRKLRAEADIAEMQRDNMQGKLLDAEEVKAMWTKDYAYVRGRLLAMSGTLAPQLVDGMTVAERKAVIDDGLYLVLDALSRGEGVDDGVGIN